MVPDGLLNGQKHLPIRRRVHRERSPNGLHRESLVLVISPQPNELVSHTELPHRLTPPSSAGGAGAGGIGYVNHDVRRRRRRRRNLDDRWRRVGRSGDGGATEGTIGGGLKPDVDAVDVKGVKAVWDETELVSVAILAEADGTFSGGDGIGGFLVSEDGDGSDCGGVEATRAVRRVVFCGGGEEVVGVGVVGEGEAAEDVDSVPVEAAFDDEDVVADEEERRRQDSDYGDGNDREAGLV